MDFLLEQNTHGLALKFSQNHGNLENYNIELNKNEKSKYKTHIHIGTRKSINDKKCYCCCDKTKSRLRGGGRQTYVEKRLVYFMYFIVDKRSFLLSSKFMVWCPYRYKCDRFPK